MADIVVYARLHAFMVIADRIDDGMRSLPRVVHLSLELAQCSASLCLERLFALVRPHPDFAHGRQLANCRSLAHRDRLERSQGTGILRWMTWRSLLHAFSSLVFSHVAAGGGSQAEQEGSKEG